MCINIFNSDSIIEPPAGYEELWFLGDNFMATTFRESVIKEDDTNMFVKTFFEVFPYCGSRYASMDTNMLSRINNAFASAVNKAERLPKYVVVVLDNGLIDYLGYSEFGIAGLLGEWIEYLANNLADMVKVKKEKLPKKAIKYEYPLFYWVAAPFHCWFADNTARAKFNNTLEATLKLYHNMRVVKLREVWDYDNNHLVSGAGRITSYGKSKYWFSVDASLKFNILKHEQFLCREQHSMYVTEKVFPLKVAGENGNEDEIQQFFKKRNKARNGRDRFRWVRGQPMDPSHNQKLPAPKPVVKAKRHIVF